MMTLKEKKIKTEDYPLIPKEPEIGILEDEQEEEEWVMLDKVAEKFKAKKIQIATEEQNKKAKQYFDRRDKLREGISRSSLHVFDPADYMDDHNSVIRDNHVLPSKVESLMISLHPIKDTAGGKKLFENLEKKMHGAKLTLARTTRKS